MARSLWRFDGSPELRPLVEREAEALSAGALVAPGLFLGEAPYARGRGAFALGGGSLLARGPPGPLPLPAGTTAVHVARGPFKTPGKPEELLAELGEGLERAPRGAAIELYATPQRWFLVRSPPGSPAFESPELPWRTSTTLSSRLARAIVNLVARPGETVVDPLCGVGVLLVEAARIGCATQGGDLKTKACGSARQNLEAAGFPHAIVRRDALEPSSEEADALVSDLPYGIRLAPHDLGLFVRTLPARARRWALVANVDLTPLLAEAGHAPRFTLRVPKPTLTRFVHVGGEALP